MVADAGAARSPTWQRRRVVCPALGDGGGMCGRFTMIPRVVVERIVRVVEAGLPIGVV